MLKRIYIDLDTLLDTRLGVINMINPEASKKAASTDAYWDRENDFWEVLTDGLVTREAFNEVWNDRGGYSADIINGSTLSNILPFLTHILTEDLVNRYNQMGDTLDEVGITINVWPYQLNDDHIEDMRDSACFMFGETIPIEIICVPMEMLTPAFFNNEYAAAVSYNFLEWIKFHFDDLARARMNCFNFIAPRIYESDVSKLSIDEKKTIIDVFRLEKLIHMDFEFIDARHFSMFRPTLNK